MGGVEGDAPGAGRGTGGGITQVGQAVMIDVDEDPGDWMAGGEGRREEQGGCRGGAWARWKATN